MNLGLTTQVAALRARIGGAERVVVLTGAGMSAESGIPTFRDAQSGFWSRFDPMALASEPGFRADPARVWAWYAERRAGVRNAQPNAGHLALGRFERCFPGRLVLISQNVDDLHQRAGNAGTLRLHGDILADQWLDPCPRRGGGAAACDTAGVAAAWLNASPSGPGADSPACSDCGNLLRPGVVWFGEALPADVLAQAERAVAQAQVLLVVGTAGAVWPAAGLAQRAAEAGAWVAILNPNDSEIDDVAHECLRGTAAELLPPLLDPLSDQDQRA
jgi:NAD-dependent deacetylase